MSGKLEQRTEVAYTSCLLVNQRGSVTQYIRASLSSGVELEIGMLVNGTRRAWSEHTDPSELQSRYECLRGCIIHVEPQLPYDLVVSSILSN